MSEPFLGQIIIVGFNFAPRGWAMCNGQILPIAQNTALFSLLGTTYGGNGQTTFALPNLQSRVPLHFGQGPGLSAYDLGQAAGSESETLTVNNLAAHTHALVPKGQASNAGDGNTNDPDGTFPAKALNVNMYSTTSDGSHLGADPTGATQTGITGGSQPFSILQPYLALNFCIALEGIFPSRN
jgi:microcystin-dependent protein